MLICRMKKRRLKRKANDAKAQAASVKAYADDARIQLDDLFKDLNAEKTGRNAASRELNALKDVLAQFPDDLNRYQRENERLTIELTASEDRAMALRADLEEVVNNIQRNEITRNENEERQIEAEIR